MSRPQLDIGTRVRLRILNNDTDGPVGTIVECQVASIEFRYFIAYDAPTEYAKFWIPSCWLEALEPLEELTLVALVPS